MEVADPEEAEAEQPEQEISSALVFNMEDAEAEFAIPQVDKMVD